MVDAVASVVHTLAQAWRRGLLVPLRLGMLCLGLSAVLTALCWNLLSTQRLLERQWQATRFMGQPGWRVTPAPAQINQAGYGVDLLDVLPVLIGIAPPSLWLMDGARAMRSPEEASVSYHALGFAPPAAGLPSRTKQGDTPCAWIGPHPPTDAEWLVASRLRCRVSPSPQGWQALNAEVDDATLILPLEAAPMAIGPSWRQSISNLFWAGDNPCQRWNMTAIQCTGLAATRSAQAEASHTVGQWNRWALPAALGLAWLAWLVYLLGLQPLLRTEFALRMALGRTASQAAKWLMGATLAHLGWVALALTLPTLPMMMALHVPVTPWDKAWLTAWCLLSTVTALCWASWDALRQRALSMLRLGRVT